MEGENEGEGGSGREGGVRRAFAHRKKGKGKRIQRGGHPSKEGKKSDQKQD